MRKTLYIIRHGETEFNRLGIVQGQGMDTDLNETGQAQAAAFFDAYKNEGFDFVYTSRLKRTHQTVAGFINELQLPTKAMYEFDEFNWGIYEGSKFGQFNADYRQLVADWRAGNYKAAPLLGDAPEKVAIRQNRGLAHIRQNEAQKILLCMHGRAMRLFLCVALNRPYCEMDDFEHQNLSLYKLELTEQGAKLLLNNDLQHLAGLKP